MTLPFGRGMIMRLLENENGEVVRMNKGKLGKSEIEHRLRTNLKAGPLLSLDASEVLGITKGHGFQSMSLPVLLELVKKVTGSTRELRAHEWEVGCAAGLMGVRVPVARQAFLGRPVRQLVEMTRWVLSHQHEEDFDNEEALKDWTASQELKEWAKQVRAAADKEVTL